MSRRPNSSLCVSTALVVLLAACSGDSPPEPAGDALAGADSSASASHLPVSVDGRWGFIDASGDIVVDPRFDRAWRYSNGLALVRIDGRYGYIGPDGAFVVEPRFTDAWHFSGGLAPVEIDTTWAYVDRSGRVVADTQFSFSNATLVETQYDDPPLQLISTGGRYGFADENGTSVIEPTYEGAWRFSDGLARVKTNGRWGYIDESGAMVIQPRFDLAWDFREGVAMVRLDDEFGYIDRSGSYVWNPGP